MGQPDFGPFTVTPDDVADLGNAFTAFVNRLMTLERQASGLAGTALSASYRDNISDEGVDAELVSDVSTEWVPSGRSAWQFKAGDLKPSACQAELRGAAFAQEILREGGSYHLVLGASLTPRKLEKRRAALAEEVAALGIDADDESVQILHADLLATWAESFPALAVWPLLGGNGHGTLTFEGWSASNKHTAAFVESDDRTTIQESIRELIGGAETVDLRVTGVSGLGKTRLVMETLRSSDMDNLVVYLKAEGTPHAVMTNLMAQGRNAIVVVDESTRDQHRSLAEMVPTGSPLRLITIGEPDKQGGLLAPTFALTSFDGDAMQELIARNQPSLVPELRRVLAETAAGNIGFALYLAHLVAQDPAVRTADLVSPEAIRQFVSQSLPTGSDFLACGVLALFPRIGYDGDLAGELELVAETLGFTTKELRAAARALADDGLLTTHGRYRAVIPHPMAVYLATAAWEEYGDQIMRDLLPKLDASMSIRLFRRAADIGEFEPTRSAVVRLLEHDGPFSSLEVIEAVGSSDLLTELAVMAPREVCRKVGALISTASEDELRNRKSIRRGLVWTLSKLAWHTYTFDGAADALLRLALAENETWTNNATGHWVELFGLMLPGTAARPPQRLRYLHQAVSNDDPRVRALAVRACAQALSTYESIMVIGELQGGVLVEGRGQPETWEQADTYRMKALDYLGALTEDPDPEIAGEAVEKLLSAIHPLLENGLLRDHLTQVLLTVGGPALLRARLELDDLGDLFERAKETFAGAADADAVDTADRQAGLQAMLQAFPPATPDDDLWVAARRRGWDIGTNATYDRVIEIGGRLDDSVAAILDVLESGEDIPASFDLGKALSALADDPATVETRLADLAAADRLAAVVGYLWGRIESGEQDAYDKFLDDGPGRNLPPSVRLSLTGRGPNTEAARHRAEAISAERPVVEVVRNVVGSRRDIEPAALASWVHELIPRVTSQDDYNALLDYVMLAMHRREDAGDLALAELWMPLLRLRTTFPALGSQNWAWGQLGIRAARTNPVEIARLVVNLVDQDFLRLSNGSDGAVLKDAVRSGGVDVWGLVMDAIRTGNWKLKMGLGGWFGGLLDLDEIRAWVGGDIDRARTVASVSTAGEATHIHDVAVYLLSQFQEDRRIESSLAGDFISGTWSGHESKRLERQISVVEGWNQTYADQRGIVHWCQELLDSLRDRLAVVVRDEAEEDYL